MNQCDGCGKEIHDVTDSKECIRIRHDDKEDTVLCNTCVKNNSLYQLAYRGKLSKWNKQIRPKDFNEPPHYHKYEIDTIDFLQKGFPPEVFRGFAIGSIVKYLHRAQEKNGLEDYLKAMDYSKRLYEFAKEVDGE